MQTPIATLSVSPVARLDRACGEDNRQIERFDEQFVCNCFLKPGPRIDNRFSGDRIGRILSNVAPPLQSQPAILQRNARELPCHRRVLTWKNENRSRPRTQKNL